MRLIPLDPVTFFIFFPLTVTLFYHFSVKFTEWIKKNQNNNFLINASYTEVLHNPNWTEK